MIAFSAQDQLVYSIYHGSTSGKKQIIGNSPLGIMRKDASFVQQLKFVSEADIASIDETFSLSSGKRKIIHNQANEIKLTFQNNKGDKIQRIVRASNDGVAFCYNFPKGDSTLVYTVEEEVTEFLVNGTGKTWLQAINASEI